MKQSTQKTFYTNYSKREMKSVIKDNTIMTVPNLALTNAEHLKKVKMGLPEQAVKAIYDPHDIYPDVRGLDLVDKHAMMKKARDVVQNIRQKREDLIKEMATKKELEAKQLKEQQEKALDELLNKKINERREK